jgi:farnesyl diphosphate synthase
MSENINEYLISCQKRVNHALDRILPASTEEPHDLHRAMRYSALNGGKRIRSALIYATGETLGANESILDQCSAAIELIHAFSLVHDDLPAIDNDDIRRGKLACHKEFDEATAILAGDALLVLAFEVLSNLNKNILSADNNLKMINLVSRYVGSQGMAGGELLDTALKDKKISIEKLALIYHLKTSYLICASILLGALAANCKDGKLLKNLEMFGLYIGLSFQIHDDIIGVEKSTEALGKPQNSDVVNNKPTYPQLIGIKNAKARETECYETAMYHLKNTAINPNQLTAISEFIISRQF